MPSVSEFFGIVIYFYFREHLPPHFHAQYGGEQVQIAIENLAVLKGRIAPRALGLVLEWASLHQDELRRDWDKVIAKQTPDPIEPLR
jgi:hypothetical protein